MSVQVILREPVDHLGRRGDVVKVATGYARNYLLPRKLALPVTEANRRQVARERVVADARDEEEKQAAAAFAERLSQVVCVIARRVGETDTLFGSVTSSDVAACLAEQSMDVDRRKIQLDEPLKKLGDHIVLIKVHREVTAKITVRIVKEGAVAVEDAAAAVKPVAEPGDEDSDTASLDHPEPGEQ